MLIMELNNQEKYIILEFINQLRVSSLIRFILYSTSPTHDLEVTLLQKSPTLRDALKGLDEPGENRSS